MLLARQAFSIIASTCRVVRYVWAELSATGRAVHGPSCPATYLRGSLVTLISRSEDGVAQSVEHWTANLATRVRSPVGEEPFDLICTFLHVQMESNWAGLSVCNCRHTGKWCGTLKAVGNTDHTRQTWIHMQTPLSPLAGCGPVGEGTSGKVLNWTVRSLNHAYTTTTTTHFPF